VSSVEFLCKYDFDFNKAAYKGISFINNKQEKQLKSKLKKDLFSFDVIDIEQQNDLNRTKLKKASDEITEWLSKISQQQQQQQQEGQYIELKSIDVGTGDLFIHRELRQRFETIWTRQTNNSKIIVEKVSEEDRSKLEKSDESEVRRLLDNLLGFTKVFRLLVEFKKPLVVHNGLMDLLFLYEKFHEPLPETFHAFKKDINNLFPLVYDTKHISLNCRKVN
jgi:poly(A)-specific ribonuclease